MTLYEGAEGRILPPAQIIYVLFILPSQDFLVRFPFRYDVRLN